MAEFERVLFLNEMKGFFSHPRCLHIPALALAGVALMAWVYPVASPFIPVVIVVFGGLELEFNNILFRTERELEAFSILPVSWRTIVLVKNAVTVALVVILFPACAMTLLYFSPAHVSWGDAGRAGLYVLTLIFPALIAGNVRSLRNPRRKSAFTLEDALEFLWMMASLAVLSLPYLLLAGFLELPWLSLVYALASCVYWYRYSLPVTARTIGEEAISLHEHP